MILRKISLCSLFLVFATNVLAHGEKDKEWIKDKTEGRKIQQVESGLRALALSFAVGAASVGMYGNTSGAHLVGIGLTGSGNILVGEFAFKDRNYIAQIAGMVFGYILGGIAGDYIHKH